mgnify:FL=1
MYRANFGTNTPPQIQFTSESQYYEALGYLAKSDGSTKIKWEDNDIKGTAWGKEGRIEFFISNPLISGTYTYTAGNGGKVLSRVNCNEFIKHINQKHNFINIKNQTDKQNKNAIKSTIPEEYLNDFNYGLTL